MEKRAAVIGLGASGISAAGALLEAGFDVRGFASSPANVDFPATIVSEPEMLADSIAGWAPLFAVISPGIPVTSVLVQALKHQSVKLISEVELAWQLQEKGPHKGRPWHCVTGTNGKTTTVGLLTAIFEASGQKVAEVGNVGLPITSQINSDADVFVVELSSFQLENTFTMRPTSAICLNVDADHLDWHGSEAAYIAAKARIYEHVTGFRYFILGEAPVQKMVQVYSDAVAIDTDKEDWCFVPFLAERGCPKALRQDVAAAVAIARGAGVKETDIKRGLESYRPAAHRQELVAVADSVRFVDDSKATNAHAALAAIKSLEPQRVSCGGRFCEVCR